MTLEEALTPPALTPEAAAEPAPTDAPPVEEQPAPEPVEAPDETVEAEADAPAETEEKKAPRAQRRIQDLSAQLKEAKEQLAQAQLPQWDFAQPATEAQDARASYENGELTLEEYLQQRDRQILSASQLQTQGEIARLKAERAEEKFWSTFEADTVTLEKSNPKFDPSSDQFDQEYVSELSDLYLESFKNNLQAAPKLSSWVNRIEKMRSKALAQGQAASSATLAEQAAQSAVAGGSGSPPKPATGKEALRAKAKESGSKADLLEFFKEDAKRFSQR